MMMEISLIEGAISAAEPSGTAEPSGAAGLSNAAGPSRASIPCGAAGPSRAAEPSGIAGPSNAAGPSWDTGPSKAPRPSGDAGSSSAVGPSGASVPSRDTGTSRASVPSGDTGPSTVQGSSSIFIKSEPRHRGRKLDCPAKKPLEGKNFYLELTEPRHKHQFSKLKADVEELGGVLEQFLSKEVACVISDRMEAKDVQKISKGVPSGTSPAVSTPSPFHQGRESTPGAADSPSNVTKDSRIVTRGKAIVQKATKSQMYGTTDVLTNAKNWNIPVKHVDVLLKYLCHEKEKFKLSGKDKNNSNKEKTGIKAKELASSGSAMSDEGDRCPEGLKCPLCLDAFKNPTLLACGHTFCKACLQEYDKQHTGRDYMECPVCRKRTKLAQDRVAGFPSNFSVKVLKDELCKNEEGSSADFCPLHSQIFRDILCVDCEEFICLTCFIDKHQGHKIKKKEEMDAHLKKKRDALHRKSKEKRAKIETSIKGAEQHKLDVYAHFENLKKNVKGNLAKKVRILRENGRRLLKRLNNMQIYHDEMLQTCIADQRQSVDTINGCLRVLASNTSRCSNMDSLNAHHLQFSDVENSLMEITDGVSMADVKQTAEMTQFFPANDNVLEVGHIELGRIGPLNTDEKVKTVADGSTNAEDLQATSKVPGTPALFGNSTLSIVRKIDLPHMMSGMAALWQNAVVIGYGSHSEGSDCFFVSGGKRPHMKRNVGAVYDVAILTDRSPVVSQDGNIFHLYNPRDPNSIGMQYTCKRDDGCFTLCSDQKDNIYALCGCQEIYVFHGMNPDPERVIPGKTNAMHICVLKTGVVITSTCMVKPSTVTVYDEEGHVGGSITGSDASECLYAAVDSLDRVLVARVNYDSDMFKLSRYIVQDSRLIVQTMFKELQIPHLNIVHQGWCYMVSLTSNMLAFAHATHLYFIKLTG